MRIFITRRIPDIGIQILKKNHNVSINPSNKVITKKELLKGIKGKDALLCLLTDPVDREVILSDPKLKVIANYAVGYDNIDVKTATEKNIAVCNTPDVLTNTTAELAWALLFSVSRRIIEADKFTRDGKFDGWAPLLMLGQDVSNKTLGVIGAGRIGTAFALKSKGFDIKILFKSNRSNEILESELNAKKVNLDYLLKNSDFISLHVPLNKSTYHMIGEKELQMMKKTAILINTSRGSVIDEKALIAALEKKWIFGAGLDVYENEPKITNKLKKLDNVVILPHIGSASSDTRNKMAIMSAENIVDALNGKIPKNCINKEIFNKKKL